MKSGNGDNSCDGSLHEDGNDQCWCSFSDATGWLLKFFVLIEASFGPTQNMTKQQVISLVCSAGGPQANTSYSTQSAIDASPSAVFFTTVQLESTGCSLSTQNQNESHWSESMTINLYMNQHESTWINMNQHARKQWDDEILGLVCGCDQAMLCCLRRSLLPGA